MTPCAFLQHQFRFTFTMRHFLRYFELDSEGRRAQRPSHCALTKLEHLNMSALRTIFRAFRACLHTGLETGFPLQLCSPQPPSGCLSSHILGDFRHLLFKGDPGDLPFSLSASFFTSGTRLRVHGAYGSFYILAHTRSLSLSLLSAFRLPWTQTWGPTFQTLILKLSFWVKALADPLTCEGLSLMEEHFLGLPSKDIILCHVLSDSHKVSGKANSDYLSWRLTH